jgi:hypothetical protein
METRTCDHLKLKEDSFYCNRPPVVAATTAASTSNIADAARTWPARALAPVSRSTCFFLKACTLQ